MSEHGRVEAKRGDLALAASSFLDILKSYWIAEPQDVRADIACDQQSLALPKKGDLPRAVTGDVDDMHPAGDWQRFSICHVAINPNRFHPLLRTPHERVRGPRQQARGRVHGAEGATSFGERGVQATSWARASETVGLDRDCLSSQLRFTQKSPIALERMMSSFCANSRSKLSCRQ